MIIWIVLIKALLNSDDPTIATRLEILELLRFITGRIK